MGIRAAADTRRVPSFASWGASDRITCFESGVFSPGEGGKRISAFPYARFASTRQKRLPSRWLPWPFSTPGCERGRAPMAHGDARGQHAGSTAAAPCPAGQRLPSPPKHAQFIPCHRGRGSTQVPLGDGTGCAGGARGARGAGSNAQLGMVPWAGGKGTSHPSPPPSLFSGEGAPSAAIRLSNERHPFSPSVFTVISHGRREVMDRRRGRWRLWPPCPRPVPAAAPRGGLRPPPPLRLAGIPRSVPGDVSGLPAGLDVLPAFPRL